MTSQPTFPRYASLALLLAGLALLSEYAGFDRWLLAAFYDPVAGVFPLRDVFWTERLLHRGGNVLVVLIAVAALAILLGALCSARLRPQAREAAYLLLCMALTTGSVALLKRSTDIACPWDLADFGGSRVYVPLHEAGISMQAPGHCFPGGHSSGAFSLLALAVLLARRGSRWARPALIGGLALGAVYGACQWLRGAHFPSHDLWSAVIAWSVACGLAHLLPQRRPPPVAVDRERTRHWAMLAAALSLMAVVLTPSSARAAAEPPISDIAFRGNDKTEPQVMLREIGIAIGDPANEAAIERSRQAIQDLGLFRSVKVEQETDATGVRVTFVVREKWYLLPYPRLSANSDGQNALGAELRWNNVWGLNHSLRAVVSSADRQDEGRGRQLTYRAGYYAPFLFDSPYAVSFSVAHSVTPVDEVRHGQPWLYDESVDETEVLLSRKFGERGAASQGWSAGGGLLWRHQDTAGEQAPLPYGDAYAWVTRLDFRDVRDRIYSDIGSNFSTRFEIADRNLGSDYSYSRLTAQYRHSLPLGDTPHQTLEFLAETGSANNGPSGDDHYNFSLGGTAGLRGYRRNHFQGDFYYLASATYLRPIGWDWLRLVVGIEAGNVFEEADNLSSDIRWSLDLGLRIRATRLVNFEFELGVALPLDNQGTRFYGSRNGF
jgi:membrane-associated PAP2 superfamily phosphatase